jgi:hypothetical protein
MGGLIETAHAILGGLDPDERMAFALEAGNCGAFTCNDQNGLKYDQDKSFGAANLRMAYNQVRVLELAGYPKTGRFVGLDVKAMRTQKADAATKHLANSRRIFLALVEKARTFDKKIEKQYLDAPRLRGAGDGRARAPHGNKMILSPQRRRVARRARLNWQRLRALALLRLCGSIRPFLSNQQRDRRHQ